MGNSNNSHITHQHLDVSNNSIPHNESGLINRATKKKVSKALESPVLLMPEDAVDKKVLYVRHGTTSTKGNHQSFEAQSPDLWLSKDGQDEVYTSIKRLKKLGIKWEDIRIYYSSDTKRVCDTLNIFVTEFWLKWDQCIDDDRLRTTRKPRDKSGKVKHLPKDEQYVEVVGIIGEVTTLMQEIKQDDKQYVIFLWHKTNKLWAEWIAYFDEKNLEGSLYMPTWGVLSFDINENSEYINYKEKKDLLHVENLDEFAQIRALFPEIPSGLAIIDFQNQLRARFIAKKELYTDYLTHHSSPLSLRTFCLANLIKNQGYSIIADYYLIKCNVFSRQEKTLILEHLEDPKIRTLVRKLFVARPHLWEDEEKELFSKAWNKGEDFYTLLKKSRGAYETASLLQSKSLDPLISTKQYGAILSRTLYFEEKKKTTNPKERNPDDTNRQDEFTRIVFHPSMLFAQNQYSHFILRAHVGEGKSIYLSHLVKELVLEHEEEILFIAAKNIKNPKDVFKNPKELVCIDALDEVTDDILKQSIKEAMRTFPGRCVISARHSESFTISEKICTLQFYPIDSNEYIESRFSKDTHKATEVKDWLQQHGLANEVKGNPLLLNLIVLLASASEDDKAWMETYWILWYDQIKTKTELYESVVRFVLAKHSKDLKEQKCTSKDLGRWMNDLWEYAYKVFLSQKNLKIDSDDASDFDAHLSILFKHEQNESYDFIHKSFYEFFLSKYFQKYQKIPLSRQEYSCLLDLFENQWLPITTEKIFLFLGNTYAEMLEKKECWEFLSFILCSSFIWERLSEEEREKLKERAKNFIIEYQDISVIPSKVEEIVRSLHLGLAFIGDNREMEYIFEEKFDIRSYEILLLTETKNSTLQDKLFSISIPLVPSFRLKNLDISNVIKREIDRLHKSPLEHIHIDELHMWLIINGHIPTIKYFFHQLDSVNNWWYLIMLNKLLEKRKDCSDNVKEMLLYKYNRISHDS